MKKLLLSLLMMLPIVAFADVVEIDGIYYNLISKLKQAEVTSMPSGKYTGSVEIPVSVSYEGTEYSVTSIGNSAFSYCGGLISVIIPNSVTSIGGCAFEYSKSLTSIIIPNSVTNIGNSAFFFCSGLKSVTIPNSVTSIGDETFSFCSSLTSITIPNSVTSIGSSAFEGCSGLVSITIGDGVTSIKQKAFSRCNSLTSVHISDISTWFKIKFGANDNNPLFFAHHLYVNNEEVTDLVVPNDVTSIGWWAFMGCSGLKSVTIPNNVTSIGGGAFMYCSGLSSITIPNSVNSIERHTFQNCSGLKSVAIPNSVTSIGEWAFYGCSGLTSVNIGSGVMNIKTQAFSNCPELTDVHCLAESVPSTDGKVFEDSYIEYATLHVPAESVDAYKAAEPWSGFKSIVSLDGGDTPEPPETQKCATPTISYTNGKLTFNCETEGAECQYTISDNDIKSGVGNEVQLEVTYTVNVYATKAGYENSETATATLCWIDQQPQTEGITNGVENVPARAVLIQSDGGILTVQGVDDGTQVGVYGIDGVKAGSAVSQNGTAHVATSLQTGSIAIVRVGEKSVKVMVK